MFYPLSILSLPHVRPEEVVHLASPELRLIPGCLYPGLETQLLLNLANCRLREVICLVALDSAAHTDLRVADAVHIRVSTHRVGWPDQHLILADFRADSVVEWTECRRKAHLLTRANAHLARAVNGFDVDILWAGEGLSNRLLV